MNNQTQPKIIRTKKLPTGNLMFVLYPGEKKPRWVWQNKLHKEVVDAWAEHLAR